MRSAVRSSIGGSRATPPARSCPSRGTTVGCSASPRIPSTAWCSEASTAWRRSRCMRRPIPSRAGVASSSRSSGSTNRRHRSGAWRSCSPSRRRRRRRSSSARSAGPRSAGHASGRGRSLSEGGRRNGWSDSHTATMRLPRGPITSCGTRLFSTGGISTRRATTSRTGGMAGMRLSATSGTAAAPLRSSPTSSALRARCCARASPACVPGRECCSDCRRRERRPRTSPVASCPRRARSTSWASRSRDDLDTDLRAWRVTLGDTDFF